MGIQQLDWSDKAYFDDCILDMQSLMVPVVLKRCISITADPDYPDNPVIQTYSYSSFSADVHEVALNEVAHSNGVLIIGDLVIWCQQDLRGPEDGSGDKFDPASVADVLLIHGAEWVLTGQPLIGRLRDPQIGGYQAYIRRRRGGMVTSGEDINASPR